MRLLLISDTHGRLGVVNELAARVQADAVIHAGDFADKRCTTYATCATLDERQPTCETGSRVPVSGIA